MEIIIRNSIKYQLDTEDNTAKVIGYISKPVKVRIPKYIRYRFRNYKVIEIGCGTFDNSKSLKSIKIPNNITEIGGCAFALCKNLQSITIPDSVTYIGSCAFYKIGLTLPKRYTEDGKLIAYKAFNNDMTCMEFQYEEGETFEIEGKIKCCNSGFHACINPLDIFTYYNGQIDSDIFIHEVYLNGDIDEDNDDDSKVCASKIEIGRRLSIKDINEIINTTY